MKLKLKSDFTDYYDHWFDSSGDEFRRVSTDGPTRQEMFWLFDDLGLRTPARGNVIDFHYPSAPTEVVVYTDPIAHCGNGKLKMPYEAALEEYPDYLATEFIPCDSESIRELHVGNRCFRLRYKSLEDWRSNVGEGEIEVLGEQPFPAYRAKVPHAIFAIDFLPRPARGDELAIDFNTAPGMRGSGIERFLPPKYVVQIIKEFLHGKQ